ncbi:hypothetical protein [Rathayibacter sp. AY1E2]|uniref:hypothetical protein n=1 Tax=Rathayibacter sp. AY1E2 TaxID=2080550 RepID=UPI0011B0C066|nr:hypothetical protein [Rathayibacter sp. AY1E2]
MTLDHPERENDMNAVIYRIRSIAASLRAKFTTAPTALPKDPFGEPPREAHDPHSYQEESWKAPARSTINFH